MKSTATMYMMPIFLWSMVVAQSTMVSQAVRWGVRYDSSWPCPWSWAWSSD